MWALEELAQEHPTGAPFGCIMTSYTQTPDDFKNHINW
jgi:hypothetical protein